VAAVATAAPVAAAAATTSHVVTAAATATAAPATPATAILTTPRAGGCWLGASGAARSVTKGVRI
jgi:hypothetical protein